LKHPAPISYTHILSFLLPEGFCWIQGSALRFICVSFAFALLLCADCSLCICLLTASALYFTAIDFFIAGLFYFIFFNLFIPIDLLIYFDFYYLQFYIPMWFTVAWCAYGRFLV
jgi:hypothetical protein